MTNETADHQSDEELYKVTLGLALSGGGYRASIFALGALLYIVDSGMNSRLSAVSSVSGGSITNGFIAQRCDLGKVSAEEFDQASSEFVQKIVTRGAVGHWLTVSYIIVLILSLIGILSLCFWSYPVDIGFLPCIALVIGWGVLLLLRGTVIDYAFGSLFFTTNQGEKKGKRVRLKEINRSIGHIFCATSLTDGAPFYFIGWKTGHLFNKKLGLGTAGNLKLQTAIRASAALPGAFPPGRLRTRPHQFRFHKSPTRNLPPVYLADGGVWNNLGVQWFEDVKYVWNANLPMSAKGPGYGHRSEWPGILPDQLLVIDASAPLQPINGILLRIPLLGEIAALNRSLNLVYYNSVSPRVEAINNAIYQKMALTEDGEGEDESKGGNTVARIDSGIGWFSGETLPRSAPLGYKPELGAEKRALEWFRYLDNLVEKIENANPGYDGIDFINYLSEYSSQVPTVLSALEPAAILNLLVHGYLAAMETCHVAYDFPLIQFRLSRFHKLFPESSLKSSSAPNLTVWLFNPIDESQE